MDKHRTAVAAGHICLDITPVFYGGRGTQMDKILEPGKLIDVGAADIHTGGAVANTGLAMQKLGSWARLVMMHWEKPYYLFWNPIMRQKG